MLDLPWSKIGLAVSGRFLTGQPTPFPRQAQATIRALIRNRKHDGRAQLQLDFRAAFVTMTKNELGEQSKSESQSESTSGKSQRDLVASRCNFSRRRRSLDRANVRHLGRIKGLVHTCLLQSPRIIFVILLL